jgi:hypothetical protein
MLLLGVQVLPARQAGLFLSGQLCGQAAPPRAADEHLPGGESLSLSLGHLYGVGGNTVLLCYIQHSCCIPTQPQELKQSFVGAS